MPLEGRGGEREDVLVESDSSESDAPRDLALALTDVPLLGQLGLCSVRRGDTEMMMDGRSRGDRGMMLSA